MSEALVIPRISRQQRSRLAADSGLRQRIVAALESGLKPLEVAAQMRADGVTTQRVWNVATQLERAARAGATKARRRVCLNCGIPFHSWGPGNRRCTSCRNGTDDGGPFEAVTLSHSGIRLR